MLLGSDNWPVEVAPNPDKSISLPVHNIALTVNGVHLLENLVLEDLAKARAYEFAFIMQPPESWRGIVSIGAGRGANKFSAHVPS
jgi:hypothetical protein